MYTNPNKGYQAVVLAVGGIWRERRSTCMWTISAIL